MYSVPQQQQEPTKVSAPNQNQILETRLYIEGLNINK